MRSFIPNESGWKKPLRKSEEKFRGLYNHAPLAYHEYDAEGHISNVNHTDLEMLGYTAEEMIGQPIWKFNVEEEMAPSAGSGKVSGHPAAWPKS